MYEARESGRFRGPQAAVWRLPWRGEPDGMDQQQRNPEKDPSDWTTGDEPMTGPQASYLETLCREAGEEFDPSLSKAAASRRIDELQQRTGRGADS